MSRTNHQSVTYVPVLSVTYVPGLGVTYVPGLGVTYVPGLYNRLTAKGLAAKEGIAPCNK